MIIRKGKKIQTSVVLITLFLAGCLPFISNEMPVMVFDNYAVYDANWSTDGNQLLLTYASADLTELGIATISQDGHLQEMIVLETDKFSVVSETQFWQADQVIFNNSPPLIYSPNNVGELIVFDIQEHSLQIVLTTNRIIRFDFNSLTRNAILVMENRDGDQYLTLWGGTGNRTEKIFDLGTNEFIADLSISPSGNLAAFVLVSDAEEPSVRSRQRAIYIIDMQSEEIERFSSPTTDGIGSLMWSPSHKCLAYIRTETGNYSASGRRIEFQNLQNEQSSSIASESLGMHIYKAAWSPTRDMMAIIPVISWGANDVFLYEIPVEVITEAGCN